MTALIILVVGALNVACFFIGAIVGQAAAKREDIKQAIPSPIEAAKRREERRAVEAERDRVSAIMRNIDRYDGTSNGQQDVPKQRGE